MFNSPFLYAGRSALSKGILRANKFSFNGIVTNLEKTISTINQVIPLYNQVKPLVNNSKSMFSSLNNFFKKRQMNTAKNSINENVINVEVNDNIENKKKEQVNIDSNTNITTPSRAFFI